VKKISNRFNVQNENNHGNPDARLLNLISYDEGIVNKYIFEI
jgi:hypothetical protein